MIITIITIIIIIEDLQSLLSFFLKLLFLLIPFSAKIFQNENRLQKQFIHLLELWFYAKLQLYHHFKE